MEKNILFVAYGGGHARMIHPVIEAIRKTSAGPQITCHVLGLTTARRIFDEHGIKSFGMCSILDKEKDKDAIEWGRHIAKTHHSSKTGIPLEESIAYLGLSFKDLVAKNGEALAWRKLNQHGRHAFFPTTIMDRLFGKLNPDFVVATNSPRCEAAALKVARQRKIPSLSVTDLFSVIKGYKLEADFVTFINETARDRFVKDGAVDPECSIFHCTGNPAFDCLIKSNFFPDRKFFENIENSAYRPIVLHADMPAYYCPDLDEPYRKTDQDILLELDAVYQATIKNNGIYLIRPHPSQGHLQYEEWLAGKKDAYLAADYDLHSLLANISLLVVRTSTVGLEACFLRKKVIQIDSKHGSDLPLAEMGIAWGSQRYEDLESLIFRAIGNDNEFELMQEQLHQIFPHTPAAPKIADLIIDNLP